jgi:hypothetical protein
VSLEPCSVWIQNKMLNAYVYVVRNWKSSVLRWMRLFPESNFRSRYGTLLSQRGLYIYLSSLTSFSLLSSQHSFCGTQTFLHNVVCLTASRRLEKPLLEAACAKDRCLAHYECLVLPSKIFDNQYMWDRGSLSKLTAKHPMFFAVPLSWNTMRTQRRACALVNFAVNACKIHCSAHLLSCLNTSPH